jgi:hypothetical protein
VDELNCDEIEDVIKSVLAPNSVGKGVATYGRAEIRCGELLRHIMESADVNGDNQLSFEEFEAFLRALRKKRSAREDAKIMFTMFDLDNSNAICKDELREIYRFFLGRNPRFNELEEQWRRLDMFGNDHVTREDFVKWLETTADPVFRQHAPPVLEEEVEEGLPPESSNSNDGLLAGSSVLSVGLSSARLSKMSKTSTKLSYRPAPGLLPEVGSRSMSHGSIPQWNERFNTKDPSKINLTFRGNPCMKTFFSRPQSLPELSDFYDRHQGFEKHRRRLHKPSEPEAVPVLSTDTRRGRQLPLHDRHTPGGRMRNSLGDVVPWRENTPRALIKPVWEPGSLLLRCPGKPPDYVLQKLR